MVSFVLYKIFSFIKETRAVHLIRGFLLLVIIYYIANNFLELKILTSVLQNATTLVIVAIPVLFQPELRRALSELGRGLSLFPSDRLLKGKELFNIVNTLVDTAIELSEKKTGALIVLERKIGLNEFVDSGVQLDAEISQELLGTIFYSGTPLHDGAVIVRGERMMAASVVLPLTESLKSPAGIYWGTRHRAAIGITEVSDAACIVVSEETGSISAVVEGKVHRNLSEDGLQRQLLSIYQMSLTPQSEPNPLFKALFRVPTTIKDEKGREVIHHLPWWTSLQRRFGQLNGFLNLRFIAVAIAVIWGLAVGLGTNPPAQLNLVKPARTLVVPVIIEGATPNLAVQINPSQIELSIDGQADALRKLQPGDIKAYIQLDKKPAPGRQKLAVGLVLPPGITHKDIKPNQLNVLIQPGSNR